MGISLAKGGNISLTKEAGGSLSAVTVGLGWDARSTDGAAFDLDASAIAVGADGNVVAPEWFVFYGQTSSPGNTIVHSGDNLTGDGDGDDETIDVKLAELPASVEKIVIVVSIYEAAARNQTFGQVTNAFMRVVNQADGTELGRYDLSEEAATETAMIFGELYRYNGDWKFRAVGQGYADGLAGVARSFAVPV